MEKIKLLSIKGFVKPTVKYRVTKGGKKILKSEPKIFFDLNVELENTFIRQPKVGEVWIVDEINMFCWYKDNKSVKFRNVNSESDIIHLNFGDRTSVSCIYRPFGESSSF